MAESIQERLAAITPATDRMAAVKTIGDFLAELEHGTIRSATRDDDGVWHAQPWVKQGILTAFRVGVIAEPRFERIHLAGANVIDAQFVNVM